MIDFDPDAKLNPVSARFRVSKRVDQQQAASMIHSMAFRRLVELLASQLSQNAMQIHEEKYSTTYEIFIYAVTPDQLEKYVQRRAMRFGYLPSEITEETPPPVGHR